MMNMSDSSEGRARFLVTGDRQPPLFHKILRQLGLSLDDFERLR